VLGLEADLRGGGDRGAEDGGSEDGWIQSSKRGQKGMRKMVGSDNAPRGFKTAAANAATKHLGPQWSGAGPAPVLELGARCGHLCHQQPVALAAEETRHVQHRAQLAHVHLVSCVGASILVVAVSFVLDKNSWSVALGRQALSTPRNRTRDSTRRGSLRRTHAAACARTAESIPSTASQPPAPPGAPRTDASPKGVHFSAGREHHTARLDVCTVQERGGTTLCALMLGTSAEQTQILLWSSAARFPPRDWESREPQRVSHESGNTRVWCLDERQKPQASILTTVEMHVSAFAFTSLKPAF
jgi:hypothetical protein